MKITYSVRWGNPYTEPPDGMSRVALRITRSALPSGNPKYMPDEIRNHPLLGVTGYCIGLDFESEKPPRRLSLETKQKIRRGRLRKRLDRKFPLFADEMYASAVTGNPDYYGKEK